MRGLRFHRNMRADKNNVPPYAWTAVSPQYAGGHKRYKIRPLEVINYGR